MSLYVHKVRLYSLYLYFPVRNLKKLRLIIDYKKRSIKSWFNKDLPSLAGTLLVKVRRFAVAVVVVVVFAFVLTVGRRLVWEGRHLLLLDDAPSPLVVDQIVREHLEAVGVDGPVAALAVRAVVWPGSSSQRWVIAILKKNQSPTTLPITSILSSWHYQLK